MTIPFGYANMDRIDENNYLTKPVTVHDIKMIIKEFKNNKAPGLSGITKTIKTNLSDDIN